MFTSTLRKGMPVLIGALMLALLVGTGTALAARARQAPVMSVHPVSQTGQVHELVGTIQSIDQARQTFSLLPTGQSKAVAVAYNTRTSIHHDYQAFQLVMGMSVRAHVMTCGDSMLYATEIEPVSAQWHSISVGMQHDAYLPGSCDGTGPHGPGYDR